MTLDKWLLNALPSLTIEGGGEGGGEASSDELDDLVKEGEDLPEDGETKEESSGEEENTEEDEEVVDETSTRLDALEGRLREKDAELVYLRAELAKRNGKQEEVVEDEGLDEEDLVRRLTDKDPKVGLKAVRELAEKIADKRVREALKDTQGLLTANDQVRAAKESDKAAVMADFVEEVKDPAYMELLTQIFEETKQQLGGQYIRNSLYQAAATAKVIYDRKQAAKRGTKNGVTEVRARQNPANTTVSGADDYTKAKTIDDLPDSMLSPRDKAAAKAAAKRMGVSQKDWLANFISESKENSSYGRA